MYNINNELIKGKCYLHNVHKIFTKHRHLQAGLYIFHSLYTSSSHHQCQFQPLRGCLEPELANRAFPYRNQLQAEFYHFFQMIKLLFLHGVAKFKFSKKKHFFKQFTKVIFKILVFFPKNSRFFHFSKSRKNYFEYHITKSHKNKSFVKTRIWRWLTAVENWLRSWRRI